MLENCNAGVTADVLFSFLDIEKSCDTGMPTSEILDGDESVG